MVDCQMGNIGEQKFRKIWVSDRYREVMNYLASPNFNAQQMCGSFCLEHKVNEALDEYQTGHLEFPDLKDQLPQST
jgi:hypothetical protein